MVRSRRVRIASITILFASIALWHHCPPAHSTGDAAPRQSVQPVRRGPSTDKIVALTFDDGPDPRYTPAVLALLKVANVPATFFLIGDSVRRHPDLAWQIAAQGHAIGNHTYTHPDLSVTPLDRVSGEIDQAQAAIIEITGRRPVLFRPPKGRYTEAVLDITASRGYQTILWTACAENSACKTPQEMVNRVMNAARPGMIVLAHDGQLDRQNTVAALPGIIYGLKARGYRFVTIPEMLSSTNAVGKPEAVHRALRNVSAVQPADQGKQRRSSASRSSLISRLAGSIRSGISARSK